MTIGVFDGLHRGHQKLIQKTVEIAKRKKIPSILYTFDPHPLEVVSPDQGVKRLFPLDDMLEYARVFGLDYFIVEKFSTKFAQKTSLSFFQYIYTAFQPQVIVAGEDFRFGLNRQFGVAELKRQQKKTYFQLEVVSPMLFQQKTVSSSRMREAAQKGDCGLFFPLLGRFFSFKGHVIAGRGVGKKIGFPTLNIKTKARLPKKGVYICQMRICGHLYMGVMNIGERPTFSSREKSNHLDERVGPSSNFHIEVHLLFASSLLSGSSSFLEEKVKIYILQRLRSEQKFDNPNLLAEAIEKDIFSAESYFFSLFV